MAGDLILRAQDDVHHTWVAALPSLADKTLVILRGNIRAFSAVEQLLEDDETTNSEAGGVREFREVASMNPKKVELGWMVITIVAVASCGGTTQDGAAGGGGSGDLGAIGGTGAVTSSGGSSGTGAGTSAPSLCAGVECAAHEDCCLADGKCFDPKASPGACVAPSTPGPQGQKPCMASSQCAADEYCQPSNQALCLGPGYCASRTLSGQRLPLLPPVTRDATCSPHCCRRAR